MLLKDQRSSRCGESDVDNLTDIGALEALIDATDVVVGFLAGSTLADGTERSDYMRSPNCLRELRRAVEQKKRLVFVRETDPQHGAVSMDVHRRDCPDDLRSALDAHPVVPWYRIKAYAQVSLRQIGQVRCARLERHNDRWVLLSG